MMNILLIVLGSNIPYLLKNRIDTAVQFVGKNFNKTNVNWFLSGGIKNPLEDTLSEAEKMKKQITDLEKKYSSNAYDGGNKWNFICDTKPTNTAENFMSVNNYLKKASTVSQVMKKIFIVTSNFHFNRAKKIAEKIIDVNTKIYWILSDAELEDSRYWENIHIKNVDDDVEKARKFYLIEL